MTETEIKNLQNAVLGLATGPVPDQVDVERAAQALRKTCLCIRSKLPAGSTPPPPAWETDIFAYVTKLTAYHARLSALVNGNKPTSATPVSQKPKTLTERVLEARGCKSLQELQETYRPGLD